MAPDNASDGHVLTRTILTINKYNLKNSKGICAGSFTNFWTYFYQTSPFYTPGKRQKTNGQKWVKNTSHGITISCNLIDFQYWNTRQNNRNNDLIQIISRIFPQEIFFLFIVLREREREKKEFCGTNYKSYHKEKLRVIEYLARGRGASPS